MVIGILQKYIDFASFDKEKMKDCLMKINYLIRF